MHQDNRFQQPSHFHPIDADAKLVKSKFVAKVPGMLPSSSAGKKTVKKVICSYSIIQVHNHCIYMLISSYRHLDIQYKL